MNLRRDPQLAQTLLQQCGRLGAADDRVARHVGALISISLEPCPYSFISAPNDFAELSSIERHWVENELVGHPARIEHYQMCPEVRRLVNDTAFEGVFVNRNEGERTFIPWFNIRKRRRHSKAPSHTSSTCSSACNLWGKSLTKHKVYQLIREHFPIGDMVHHAAGTTSMRSHELAAAETLFRETCVALIRILETHTMERPDDRS